MEKQKLESELVKYVMPNASESELADATRRWFAFLQILIEIVEERNRQASDSRESKSDDRFDASNTNT